MSIVDLNKGQLQVGEKVVNKINDSIKSYKEELDADLDAIKDAGKSYKVNLDSTIVISGLLEGFSTMQDDLASMDALAAKQFDLVEKYESGDLKQAADQLHMSEDQFLVNQAFGMSNQVNPNTLSRVGATIGMGIFKFGEGFTEFFEDIGDCAITLGAGVTSLLGFKDTAKSMKDFAKRDLAVELFENNEAFDWINRNSYFDKDSTYAKFFKFGGKVTAAIVTGKVASNIYMSRASSATKSLDAAQLAEKASKVSSKASKITNMLSSHGSNVTSNLQSGYDLKTSWALGTAATGTSWLLAKGVTNPLSERVGNKLAETELGSAINRVDQKAAEVFGKETKDAVGEFGKNAIDTTVKTGKKETTGNLVGNDGNEKSLEDKEAEYAANATIDTVKGSVEKTVEKSVEQSAEQAVEKTVEKTVEQTVEETVAKTVVKSVL